MFEHEGMCSGSNSNLSSTSAICLEEGRFGFNFEFEFGIGHMFEREGVDSTSGSAICLEEKAGSSGKDWRQKPQLEKLRMEGAGGVRVRLRTRNRRSIWREREGLSSSSGRQSVGSGGCQFEFRRGSYFAMKPSYIDHS